MTLKKNFISILKCGFLTVRQKHRPLFHCLAHKNVESEKYFLKEF